LKIIKRCWKDFIDFIEDLTKH